MKRIAMTFLIPLCLLSSHASANTTSGCSEVSVSETVRESTWDQWSEKQKKNKTKKGFTYILSTECEFQNGLSPDDIQGKFVQAFRENGVYLKIWIGEDEGKVVHRYTFKENAYTSGFESGHTMELDQSFQVLDQSLIYKATAINTNEKLLTHQVYTNFIIATPNSSFLNNGRTVVQFSRSVQVAKPSKLSDRLMMKDFHAKVREGLKQQTEEFLQRYILKVMQ